MCGICGIVLRDVEEKIHPRLIRQMCDQIIHRGPDDVGYYLSGRVALGMRRLSIIDLESGRQPVHNEDNTIQIVFNGEIYNYKDLRHILLSSGHSFYTQSDTEVIVHAYEIYGTKCFELLRGMFGVALWDSRQQRLLLAVDRIGIKPLYYAWDEQGIVFGSELNCLLASGRVARQVDYDALAQYFTFGYIPAPLTIFQGVYKLLPGHWLTWNSDGQVEIEPYWELSGSPIRKFSSPAQLREELLTVLRNAVQSHLVSDVPIGAFLSGGVDSSAVVAMMSQVSSKPVKTFSIGFSVAEHNELDKARLVAQRFGTDHHEMIVEPEAVDVLPKIISHFGEPFADSSALPTYYVSKMAREYVKVALSGDGGDEFFVGYTVFQGIELARYLNAFPTSVRKALMTVVEKMPLPRSPALVDKTIRWKKRISDSMLPPRLSYYNKITKIGLEEIWHLLSPDLQQQLINRRPLDVVTRYLDTNQSGNGSHPLEAFVYAGIKVSLPWDMLVKVDRMSMANSLEVRVPLLDHVLAEFVAGIPIEQRFPQWRLKGLLKDTMSGILPKEILHSPKHGFTIPLAGWFRGNLADFAAQVLLDRQSIDDLWNRKTLEKLLQKHKENSVDVGSIIWALLVFQLWKDQYGKQ